MQRNVRVAKNPSNLTKFVNVNQRYKKPSKKFELSDNPTDQFLKQLAETDHRHIYSKSEYIQSFLVHRNPIFTKSKQQQIK
ncbi:hypothetical protein pb186bvf_003081 [Paramecium bursaria]